MKARTDFISNSSSSSFIINLDQPNILDEFRNYAALLATIDYMWIDWDDHLDAKDAYSKLMANDAIRKQQESTDYHMIEYGDDPNRIRITNKILNVEGCLDPILDLMSLNADSVEIGISDTWDYRATRLIQFLTILDVAEYSFKCADKENHLQYTELGKILDESKT